MKMAFLVICPGSFQYAGTEKKGAGGSAVRRIQDVDSERERGAFIDLRKGHAAPFRAHYHS